MLLIVDGDNAPKVNTLKLGELDERDRVIIYYASDNKFFLKQENRVGLRNLAKCSLTFQEVKRGSCAVDFAAAMELAITVSREPEGFAIVISNDRHFDIISENAQRINSNWHIVRASTIEEAVSRYKILECRSLQELREYFMKMFGTKQGNNFYYRITNLFKEAETECKKIKCSDLRATNIMVSIYRRFAGSHV